MDHRTPREQRHTSGPGTCISRSGVPGKKMVQTALQATRPRTAQRVPIDRGRFERGVVSTALS